MSDETTPLWPKGVDGHPIPTLPHHLRPGLKLVFIGYNPSIFAAQAGHYYARPGNVFWRQLNESGLLPRTVSGSDDGLLMDEAGIGFTDLCPRPSVRADELMRDEIAEGGRRLLRELEESQPQFAAFSGKGIWAHVIPALRSAGREPVLKGATPGGYGEVGALEWQDGRTLLWVIPSSSGLASKWHRERLEWMRRLVAAVKASDEQVVGTRSAELLIWTPRGVP